MFYVAARLAPRVIRRSVAAADFATRYSLRMRAVRSIRARCALTSAVTMRYAFVAAATQRGVPDVMMPAAKGAMPRVAGSHDRRSFIIRLFCRRLSRQYHIYAVTLLAPPDVYPDACLPSPLLPLCCLSYTATPTPSPDAACCSACRSRRFHFLIFHTAIPQRSPLPPSPASGGRQLPVFVRYACMPSCLSTRHRKTATADAVYAPPSVRATSPCPSPVAVRRKAKEMFTAPASTAIASA